MSGPAGSSEPDRDKRRMPGTDSPPVRGRTTRKGGTMRRTMIAVLWLVGACHGAAFAQQADSAALAEIRTEAVRSRGFIRGAETQLSKVIALIDAALSDSVGVDPVPPDTVPEPPADTVAYDVAIPPGQSIQSAVNSNPAGTVFLVRAGVHVGQKVEPKQGQQFIGEAGAILDGGGTQVFAFGSYGNPGANVTLRGLTLRNYHPSNVQQGVIQGDNAVGWTLEDMTIIDNYGVGVSLGQGMVVRNSVLSRNSNLGVGGFKADGVLIEGNVLDGNGYDGLNGERAGIKLVAVRDPVIRNNIVTNSVGRGIWLDTDIFDAVVEGNTVSGSREESIWLEVVCGGTVRGNTVSGGGLSYAAQGWPEKAGIQVVNGVGVTIEDNDVSGNRNGISVMGAQGYPTHACVPATRDVTVRGNRVTQDGGTAAGTADDNFAGSTDYASIRFEGNVYTLSGGAAFRWQGAKQSLAQWQAGGRQ